MSRLLNISIKSGVGTRLASTSLRGAAKGRAKQATNNSAKEISKYAGRVYLQRKRFQPRGVSATARRFFSSSTRDAAPRVGSAAPCSAADAPAKLTGRHAPSRGMANLSMARTEAPSAILPSLDGLFPEVAREVEQLERDAYTEFVRHAHKGTTPFDLICEATECDPRAVLRAYCERVGLSPDMPLKPDMAMLRLLQRAHTCSVPFENIDCRVLRRTIDLDLNDTFDKIVRHGRGGVCIEQNLLFAWVLRLVGFDVDLLSMNVCVPPSGAESITWGPEPSHLTPIVRLDGQRLIPDVGFPTSAMVPLAWPEHGRVVPLPTPTAGWREPDAGSDGAHRVQKDDVEGHEFRVTRDADAGDGGDGYYYLERRSVGLPSLNDQAPVGAWEMRMRWNTKPQHIMRTREQIQATLDSNFESGFFRDNLLTNQRSTETAVVIFNNKLTHVPSAAAFAAGASPSREILADGDALVDALATHMGIAFESGSAEVEALRNGPLL